MNIKEYISSGIIESYVLGVAAQAERDEFEAMCAQYPEIAAAREAFEVSLEARLMDSAPPPPALLRDKVQTAIQQINTPPVTEISEQEESSLPRIGLWKWLAAASIILMAGSLVWAFSLNNKFRKAQADNRSLKTEMEQSSAELAQLRSEAGMLHRPGLKMAALQGTAVAPGAFATIYWDTASPSRNVYLMINNLPQPAPGKQYQLWALIDGQPHDLGVFNFEIEKHLLVQMKGVQTAQAFAITLEPAGGSPGPTLDAMYAHGKL